jgi:hypothetical protein
MAPLRAIEPTGENQFIDQAIYLFAGVPPQACLLAFV